MNKETEDKVCLGCEDFLTNSSWRDAKEFDFPFQHSIEF